MFTLLDIILNVIFLHLLIKTRRHHSAAGAFFLTDQVGKHIFGNKKTDGKVPTIKQVLNYRTKKKEYGQFCSYSFS